MKRRMGIAAILEALVVGALVVATPVTALADDVEITWSGISSGQTVAGTKDFSLDARTGIVGLKSFSVRVEGPEGAGPWCSDSCSWDALSAPASATISVSWGTSAMKVNGTYNIVAVAEHQSFLGLDPHSTTRTITANVNNPPKTPTGVNAGIEGNNIVVVWAKNPEADMQGYRVQRSQAGGAFTQVGSVPASTLGFVDVGPTPGVAYGYRIVAVRKSPVDANGIASGSPSAATAALTVPIPPSPTPDAGGATQAAGQGATGTEAGTTASTSPTPFKQPLVLGNQTIAPVEVPKAPPYQVVAPKKDRGFAPLLPYTGQLPEATEEAPEAAPEQAQAGGVTTTTTDTRLISQPLDRARFLAGGLLLLVVAFHFGRMGRRLLMATPPAGTRRGGGSGGGGARRLLGRIRSFVASPLRSSGSS
ncbi:MAG: hypothetical protein ACRDJ4_15815 [Actinomycetota bacterium]